MDEQYASDIERYIDQGDRAIEGTAPQDWSAPEQPEYEQESDYDDTDTPEYLAGIYARAQAAERETRAGHDAQLDREIKRMQETACCDDGQTHFSERDVLNVMIELGKPYNIDRARKVWHERTFSWDTRAKARNETDPKIDKQSAYEKVNAMEDIAALKKQYAVKRTPHRGRMEDDPRLDSILDRALGPVRGNALQSGRGR